MEKPKKQLTDKQTAFLEHLLGDARGNVRLAMDMAGYAKTTSVQEVVGNLRDEIMDRTSMMIVLNAPKAAFGITDVLDDPSAMGAKNAIAAAKEVLDRTGLVKKEKVEVETNGGGMFILQPKTMGE